MRTARAVLEGLGYNALTDDDPSHYSLFADTDNVLIKESVRGDGTLAYNTEVQITHSLGYVPMVLVWGQVNTSRYRLVNFYEVTGADWRVYVNSTTLYIRNVFSATYTGYKYFIFYDNMV